MKTLIQKLIVLLVCTAKTWSDCDVCQSSNIVACHRENQYSLCIKGVPTKDFITCPENHVCTSGPYVCYPLPRAKPSCVRKTNLCGVCNHNKVYACTNETTIAFCYGHAKPLEEEDVSYCLGGTVCDIYSENGFCSERHLVKPSCITTSDVTAPEAITTTTTSKVISTTTSKKPFITTTIQPATTTRTVEQTTKTTTAKPRTTTTTTEATEATEQTTTNTKIEPNFTTTTVKAVTRTSSKKPITTPNTTREPTTTTTRKRTATTPTVNFTATTTTAKPTTTSKPTSTTTSKESVIPITKPQPTTTTTVTELTNKTTKTISTTTTTTPRPTTATTVTQRTTSTLVSVTPSIPNDPAQICKNAGTTGSFYAGDPTCTTFVLCYMMNGSIIGLQKECPSTQFFAPGAKSCSSQKPDSCV